MSSTSEYCGYKTEVSFLRLGKWWCFCLRKTGQLETEIEEGDNGEDSAKDIQDENGDQNEIQDEGVMMRPQTSLFNQLRTQLQSDMKVDFLATLVALHFTPVSE